MSSILEEPKRLFHNNTAGWIGVVTVGPTGAPEGQAVEPDGTVWLSERECRLTAHAPRMAKDNPFLPQAYQVRNPETGASRSVEVIPLTIVEDDRSIPTSDRFIPGAEGVATGPMQGGAPTPEPSLPQPTAPAPQPPTQSAVQAPPPPPVPPGVQAAVDAARERDSGVGGSMVSAGVRAGGDERAVDPLASSEEHAAVATPDKEETGSAVPPQGAPPEGEYAAHEEVGTPDAPAVPKPYVAS